MREQEPICAAARKHLIDARQFREKTGKLDDGFFAYTPSVSPNHHWMALRDFYPPQSEVPFSEEYLLYDLAKGKSENRSPNLTAYTADTVGRVMYPVVAQDTPFEHGGLPANQTHRFSSDAFYWSQDSQEIVFADAVEKTLSIVLIKIDRDQTQTFAHKVTPSEACEQGSKGDLFGANVSLSQAEVTSNGIELQFRSGDYGACKPVAMIVTTGDFTSAQSEVHNPPHRRDYSTMTQQ